jgi:hypothetical protein
LIACFLDIELFVVKLNEVQGFSALGLLLRSIDPETQVAAASVVRTISINDRVVNEMVIRGVVLPLMTLLRYPRVDVVHETCQALVRFAESKNQLAMRMIMIWSVKPLIELLDCDVTQKDGLRAIASLSSQEKLAHQFIEGMVLSKAAPIAMSSNADARKEVVHLFFALSAHRMRILPFEELNACTFHLCVGM